MPFDTVASSKSSNVQSFVNSSYLLSTAWDKVQLVNKTKAFEQRGTAHVKCDVGVQHRWKEILAPEGREDRQKYHARHDEAFAC